MEKEGERRREEEKRQVQRATQQQQQPPQQHQKCPRCDSMNTKFCYFNNYSLSQPRHFCKSCKRYWTHGGTFRNIPVGGGSRKVKRAKTNSSSSSSSSSPKLLTTQPQQNLSRPSPPLTSTMVQSPSPYYNHVGVGSSYLSSLATFHSLNTPSQPFNRYLKVGGGDVTASSNSSPLVSGFNAASSLPPRFHHQSMLYPAQQQQQQQQQQQRLNIIQSNMASAASSVSHSAGLGPQSLINNVSTSANHRAGSDASLWSAATISGNIDHVQNNVKGGSTSSSSFIPNHNWLRRPGFGPPQ